VTRLDGDGRDWLEERFGDARAVSSSAAAIGAMVVSDLLTRFERGNDARRALLGLADLAEVGAAARARELLKRERMEVKLSRDGRIISLPARLGSRPIDPSTGQRSRTFQHRLWLEMGYAELTNLLTEMGQQASRLAEEVEALSEVVAVYERFPDAPTARAAYELAGVEPPAWAELP
jgi:hypothetical protein